MTDKEFNLSEKRKHIEGWFYRGEDVKKFIKRLKDEINKKQAQLDRDWNYEDTLMGSEFPLELIDKLAGDKLTEQKGSDN